MPSEILEVALESLVSATHGSPFDILGAHQASKTLVSVRAFRPTAKTLTVVNDATNKRTEMEKLREEGFFEVRIKGDAETLKYHFEAETFDGKTEIFKDPYAFRTELPISDFDLHLFGEGNLHYSYDKFGAHIIEVDGVKGVYFAVWAPNAYRVSIVGNFNAWDERQNPMQPIGGSGVWQLFIPEIGEGELYRYDLRSHNQNYHGQKSDPYGFRSEMRPSNASIVHDIDKYTWTDDAWMKKRAEVDSLKQPMSVYEVHLGSWRRREDGTWMTYQEFSTTLVDYCKHMGYTHIELMPISEHPFDGSWGYQVTGYFAVTSRFGTPDDFKYFVDVCHNNDIGIILDWVPAHFPKDGYALSYFDGTHLYEHADPRKGEHPDWGTYIFNYGRNEVRNFLISNALFWLKEYHIDGLRVDAVSSMLYLNFGRNEGEWIPNEHGGNENLDAVFFLRSFNEIVHREFPGAITVAEESTSWPMVSRPTYLGGLGFTMKWNMGWMHDTLDYMKRDPIYRRFHHNQLTFSLMYAFSENFVLSLSHDEVVHLKGSIMEKMAGDWWQKFASVRLLTGYQMTHPGKKLMFMGQEIGQWREWSEERSLDWFLLSMDTHSSLQKWVADLNKFYKNQPSLYEHDFDPAGFQWIEANDADNSTYAYIRFADDTDDFLIIAANFTPVPHYNYRIGVPKLGMYQEVLNSDSSFYGGGNVGNAGSVVAETLPWRDWQQSMSITVPPLGIVVFKLS
ncbi:MAG: 1,4-alpha-glucan branching protein GlgB [Aggregatilineales bacterium]